MATLVSIAMQSWTVFWLAILVVVGTGLHSGGIRLHGRRSD